MHLAGMNLSNVSPYVCSVLPHVKKFDKKVTNCIQHI
jgi:hypothetical protein